MTGQVKNLMTQIRLLNSIANKHHIDIVVKKYDVSSDLLFVDVTGVMCDDAANFMTFAGYDYAAQFSFTTDIYWNNDPSFTPIIVRRG